MGDIWLDDAEVIPGVSAGPMNQDGSRKLLLHSTEGTSIEGAVATFRARPSHPWSHLTVDCRRRRIAQHLALNVAGRSLKNLPGGADETNRDGTFCVQIELIGFAGRPESIGSPADLDWFGRHVVAPIVNATGIPLVTTVRWVSYPASYGYRAAQRLSVAAWDAYSGLLGHQHAPDNDHGDPGAIDITRVIAAARHALTPTPDAPTEVDMFIAQSKDTGAALLVAGGQSTLIVSNEELEAHKAIGIPHLAVSGRQFQHYEAVRNDLDVDG